MNLLPDTNKILAVPFGGLVIWLTVHPSFAQFRIEPEFTLSVSIDLDEVDRAVLQQLKQSEGFLAISRWDSAIDLYQRVMQEHGSQLIPVQLEGDREGEPYQGYVSVREYSQRQIVSWSDQYLPALQVYRRRVDREAKYLYEQGVERRDTKRLEQVVNQFFASSFGDDALDALAEIALERGDYTAARGYWRRISPVLLTLTSHPFTAAMSASDGSQNYLTALSDWLDASSPDSNHCVAYPDTDRQLAVLFARLVVVSVMERSLERARVELDLFGHRWPDASGIFAGQLVNLRKALESLYQESLSWPAPRRDIGWWTFAGNAARNGMAERDLDIVPRVIWTRQIGPPRFTRRLASDRGSGNVRRWGRQAQAYFPYFPVAIDNLVLVRDEDFVWAFDVTTGRAAFPTTSQNVDDAAYGRINEIAYIPRPPVALGSQHWSLPQFSLTVFHGNLFGRLGSAMSMVSGDHEFASERDDVSFVVALDLDKQGKLIGNLVRGEEPGFQFEGSPLVDDRFVYLVSRREDAVRTRSYVSAYDWETGRRRWRTSAVSAERPGQGVVQDAAGRLLSMQHGRILFNTNQGVVCALDARRGNVLWSTRYPRIVRGSYDDPDVHLLRGMNPCLIHRDLVIVAPWDCRQVFALDAMTGQFVWESTTPHDVQHLLGVRGDKLLASGDSLWWLDVHTGRVLCRFPPLGNAGLTRSGPSPRGAGRGLLTKNTVWWPTRHGIFLFDLHTQRHIDTIWFTPELAAAGVSGGNLVMSQGHLIVATADRLIAFNESGTPAWLPTTTLNPLRN